jgi:hypothetical protein
VIQGKHPVVAVPVFSRRRHKVRHTIKELSLKNSPDRDFSPRLRGFGAWKSMQSLFMFPIGIIFVFYRTGMG